MGVVDLGELRRKQAEPTADDALAQIIETVHSLPEEWVRIRDDEDIAEAFELGAVASLKRFVGMTTGGVIKIPEDVFHTLATLEWVALRGFLWVQGLAWNHAPVALPLADDATFHPELVKAYMVSSAATAKRDEQYELFRDNIARLLERHATIQEAKGAVLAEHMNPGTR